MNVITVQPMRVEFASEGVMKIEKIAAGVGIIMFNAAAKLAAGIHVLRGESVGQTPKNPAYFADTGIAYMIEQFKQKGITPPFLIAVAGGSSLLAMSDSAKAGSTIVPIVMNFFKDNDLSVKVEETGGNKVRNMLFNIDERKIKIV